MEKKNNPILKLNVKDVLADEKLNLCKLQTQGVYFRILCCFHLSDPYGGVLFEQGVFDLLKQNFKQNSEICLSKIPSKIEKFAQAKVQAKNEICLYFAYIISRQIGRSEAEVMDALDELLTLEILKIEELNDSLFLYQRRMVQDFSVSTKRAAAGKLGGKASILLKQNFKQNSSKSENFAQANFQANKNFCLNEGNENAQKSAPETDENGESEKTKEERTKEESNTHDINNINNNSDISKEENKKEEKAKNFKKPTIEEVRAYCSERNKGVDAEHFYSYYESNGWRVGRNPMKDWRAAVRTWERNGYGTQAPQGKAAQKTRSQEIDAAVEAAQQRLHGNIMFDN